MNSPIINAMIKWLLYIFLDENDGNVRLVIIWKRFSHPTRSPKIPLASLLILLLASHSSVTIKVKKEIFDEYLMGSLCYSRLIAIGESLWWKEAMHRFLSLFYFQPKSVFVEIAPAVFTCIKDFCFLRRPLQRLINVWNDVTLIIWA